MQTYNVANIIREVRILIDDSTQTSADLQELGIESDLTYNETDELIRKSLLEAIRVEHNLVDAAYVMGKEDNPTPENTSNGTGTLQMPDDFLRLLSVKMGGWLRPCTDIIGINDPRYNLQHNKYSRGNRRYPVVAISGNQIEYYSVPDGVTHTCEYIRYLPIPIVSASTIETEELLYNRIVTRTAALTLVTLKDDLASSFFELLK